MNYRAKKTETERTKSLLEVREIDREKEVERKREREIDRQTDRQRQTDMQTDRDIGGRGKR